MKRRLFKTILLVVLAVFSFSLSACEQLNFTEKLDLIAPDADYGFSIYNNRYLVVDGAHYELEKLAYDVVKEKDGSQEVYGATVCGGNMYYLYQYSAKRITVLQVPRRFRTEVRRAIGTDSALRCLKPNSKTPKRNLFTILRTFTRIITNAQRRTSCRR